MIIAISIVTTMNTIIAAVIIMATATIQRRCERVNQALLELFGASCRATC